MSITQKVVSAFLIVIGIMLFSSIFVSYNLNEIDEGVQGLKQKDFRAISVLLEADRDSYQSNLALSYLFNIKDQGKVDLLIQKGVKENLVQVRTRFNKFKNALGKYLDNENEFKEFDKYYNFTEQNTQEILSYIDKGDIQKAKELYFSKYNADYEAMRNLIDFFSEESYKVNEKNMNSINSLISTSLYIFIIISLISLSIVAIFSYYLRKNIDSSFFTFTKGILGFFDYLNRKSDDVELLDASKNDEISKIAKVVNENIAYTKNGIEEDREVISEIISVLGDIAQGDLSKRITLKVSNPALNQLKDILNKMGSTMQYNIDNILNVLEEYTNYKYTDKVESKELKKHFLRLSKGINGLNDSITNMLILEEKNGMTLSKSSIKLLKNVEILSKSSNHSATFLEETAAALEEVTNTVAQNTQHIEQISQYASDLQHRSNKGEKLANDTANSMTKIDEQVRAINEAIGVIDQISFQTNILSLNAAVEAATAGEAGKGFAVVAQEVRNLANRSAEAAKQIKDLVEDASQKASQGKSISDKMIADYHKVNDNIDNTLKLIKGIAISSKEQQSGVEQINTAVAELDHQTQNNANVASITNEIAIETQKIAKTIVEEVEEKEFRGKAA